MIITIPEENSGGLMVECPPCTLYLEAEKKKGKIIATVDTVNGGQIGDTVNDTVNDTVSVLDKGDPRKILDTPDSDPRKILDTPDSDPRKILDTPDRDPRSVLDGRMSVYKILTNNPKATNQEIAKALGIAERNVRKHIRNLKDAGLIKRIGSDRAGYWQIIKKDET